MAQIRDTNTKATKKQRNGGFGDCWGNRIIPLGGSTSPNDHPFGPMR
jgi:hypothetical protein